MKLYVSAADIHEYCLKEINIARNKFILAAPASRGDFQWWLKGKSNFIRETREMDIPG